MESGPKSGAWLGGLGYLGSRKAQAGWWLLTQVRQKTPEARWRDTGF
jgi:hypothetical protein